MKFLNLIALITTASCGPAKCSDNSLCETGETGCGMYGNRECVWWCFDLCPFSNYDGGNCSGCKPPGTNMVTCNNYLNHNTVTPSPVYQSNNLPKHKNM